ncbi:MAG: chromosomal replication initiator protein DnaA [Candidatus Omnitrophica bacterium]|jgi:chromosomal replication initiator protein|nr:chromosomal replication initiator protein DnaA [Candidatus Omnitrophota bacterium]MDD4012765.1 chromosomal replication initiator protein DnaA [Candidatus Omnitrophota bacterium]
MKNIWEKSLSVLRSEVNDQVFNNWFLPIQEVLYEGDSLVLGVPNKFFAEWIKEKYISLLLSAVQQATGKETSISFQIVECVSPTVPAEPAVSLSSGQKSRYESGGDAGRPAGWWKQVFSGKQLPESSYQAIGLNPSYTFDNFVVGQSNNFAHAACRATCDKLSKLYNPLFLYGGVGLGKTHLMQAMACEILSRHPKTKILYISSEEFMNQLIDAIKTKTTQKFRNMYRNLDVLIIDDIQFIAGKASTQEEFFHTFNALYDSHKQILLSSDRSPQEIPGLEERLVSRFAWGLAADIQPPDFETRMAILQKKCELSSVAVSNEVLYFLAEKVRTNIREMEGALIRVVAYSNMFAKEITVPLARDVLKGMISAEEKKITLDQIQKIVASYFDVKITDLKTKKRTRAIAYPRQFAMYLSRTLTDHSLPDIGLFYGGRDHTTVLHACDKISKELSCNENTRSVVQKLTDSIRSG